MQSKDYILGIDPGTTQTAYVLSDVRLGLKPIVFAKEDNEKAYENIELICIKYKPIIALECIQSFGMPVGLSTFETCYFIGKLMNLFENNNFEYSRVYRAEEKNFICHNSRANDATIKQALKDEFGEVGTKKNNGFFYGFHHDIWSAFAVLYTHCLRDGIEYRKE